MSLLEIIVNHLQVADVPELIVEYLAGDECLDDETIKSVFVNVYRDENGYTYLDRTKTVLHSFNDEPAVNCEYEEEHVAYEWYRNGILDRQNGPAMVYKIVDDNWSEKVWIHSRKISKYEVYVRFDDALTKRQKLDITEDVLVKQCYNLYTTFRYYSSDCMSLEKFCQIYKGLPEFTFIEPVII